MSTLEDYLSRVLEAVKHEDGTTAAKLLSLKDAHVSSLSCQIENPLDSATVAGLMRPPWNYCIDIHLKTCWFLHQNDVQSAFSTHASLVKKYSKMFQAGRTWELPVLSCFCRDLRILALLADHEASLQTYQQDHFIRVWKNMEIAANILNEVVRALSGDTKTETEKSRRNGMLPVVNQLFKIYFRIRKRTLCKALFRTIDHFPPEMQDHVTKAQRITYKYFKGKTAACHGELVEANEHLTYTFEHCLRDSFKNKRSSLMYLIPCRMKIGQFPTTEVLQKYNLMEFHKVSAALRMGDMRQFNEAMDGQQLFFRKSGVFFMLERLRIILKRNFFKKVCLAYGSHQVSFDTFTAALSFAGHDDTSTDAAVCFLTNLIAEGFIKGYISHDRQILVLSKQEAFPKIC